MKVLIVAAVCYLLLTTSVDCKKAKNEKGKVAKDEKAKLEKKAKVEKVKEIIVEKVIEHPVEEEHPAPAEVHHEVHNVEVHTQVHEHIKPKIVKPKALKVLSAYEQCKAECRKARDSVHAQEYVEQLRQELAAAEATLAEQKAAAAAAEAEHHEEPAPNNTA